MPTAALPPQQLPIEAQWLSRWQPCIALEVARSQQQQRLGLGAGRPSPLREVVPLPHTAAAALWMQKPAPSTWSSSMATV